MDAHVPQCARLGGLDAISVREQVADCAVYEYVEVMP
jgi:hypothetical protein